MTAHGASRPRLSGEQVAHLIEEYRRTGDRRLRNRVVEAHLHLVDHYVASCARGGLVSKDDARQTALLALIGAVDRFDPAGGASLITFATRTIDGELKRYLRDRSWMVRPPRSAQETHLNLRRASEQLSQELGRAPTVAEFARHLDIDEDHVHIGLVAGLGRRNESVDHPARDDDSAHRLEATLGHEDVGFDLTEARISLRAGMSRLDDRQRDLLHMRFAKGMSQPDIAREVGVSQSYVSRIIRSALSVLRSEFS